MRSLPFILLALFTLAACGGGGSDAGQELVQPEPVQHVPEILDLKLSPASALYLEGGGSVVVTAEVGFRDSGRDIQSLWVQMPDGTFLQFDEASAAETGTFAIDISMSTETIGALTVECWLVDRAGDTSAHLTADFIVIGDVESSAGGIWSGSISNDLTGQSFEIHGMITEDNSEGRFLINGATLFVLQDISADGRQIAASISVSVRPDSQIVAEQWPNLGVLTGSLVERTRIEAEWWVDSGEFGKVTLEYDDLYERGSDITRLAGTWKAPWGTVYAIDSLGEFFGQWDDGCVHTGQVEIIDATYDVYRVTFEDWCLPYTAIGLGVLRDEVDTDDAFELLLGEGWFIADTWQRQ